MTQDTIRINPDSGLPAEEIAFYLAVSDAVKEHLDREDIARAFGRYLSARPAVGFAQVSLGEAHVYPVQIAARDDGGYSMTIAEPEVVG